MRARRVTSTLLALVVLVLVDRGLDRVRRQWDLTAERSLTLSDQTREVVASVTQRVKITAALSRALGGRAEAAALLDRYHRLNRRITWRLIDPDQQPGETARLGIDPATGGVAVAASGRIERGPIVTEQDVTSAIARVVRGRQPGVCFVLGHGENDPRASVGEGMAAAAGALVANGYRIRSADLVTRAALPDGCEAVVLANPQVPLGDAEPVIARYLAGGGRALVLADPSSPADISSLIRPYGLGFERGLIFEGDSESRLGDDPLTPVVREHRSPNPAVRRLGATLYPGAMAITTRSSAAEGLSTSVLASSTRLAYLERAPATPRFDPGTDLPGPHAIVAAADKSAVVAGRVRRTRLIVASDVDWATNAFIGDGANSKLLVQSLDWLTLDEDLVSVSANIPQLRPLELTAGRLRYARLLMAGGVPLAFLLAGGLVWAVRRGL